MTLASRKVKPNTCHFCREPVIWAQVKTGRGYRPVSVEVCAAGDGDISLTADLIEAGRVPLAEKGIRTRHRLHEPHCEVRKRLLGVPAAAPARAFSADSFKRKGRFAIRGAR